MKPWRRLRAEPLTLKWRALKRQGECSLVDLDVFYGGWLAIEQCWQVDALLSRPGATIEDVIKHPGPGASTVARAGPLQAPSGTLGWHDL